MNEVHSLASAYLDNELSEEQFRTLEQEINRSDEACAEFIRWSFQNQFIRNHVVGTQAAQHALAEDQEEDLSDDQVLYSLVDDAKKARERSEIELRANRALAAEQDSQAVRTEGVSDGQGLSRPERKVIVIPMPVAWLALAAVIGLAATFLYQWVPQNDRPLSGPPPVAEEAASPTVVLAHIVETLDAQWAGGANHPVGSAATLYGGSHDLKHGMAVIELMNETRVVLEAPIAFDLIDEGTLALHRGRLVAHVPPAGIGFTIETPTTRIVDLGTEFGVDVDAQEGTRIKVLDGLVRLEAESDERQFEPVVVQAGSFLEVRPDSQPQEIEDTANLFYRALPNAYERMVREARPLVYWNFDGMDDQGRLAGLGKEAMVLEGVGASDLKPPADLLDAPNTGAVSNSLWLNRLNPGISGEVLDDFDPRSGMTVEAWVWVPADTDRRMRVLASHENNSDGWMVNGFGLGVSGYSGNRLPGGPVLMFTSYAVFDAFSQVPVPTDRWVHVAVSLDEHGVLQMSIDGKQVPHRIRNDPRYSPQPGDAGTLRVFPARAPFGVGGDPQLIGDESEHWVGGIDEVALYDRVLTQEELAAHAAPDEVSD